MGSQLQHHNFSTKQQADRIPFTMQVAEILSDITSLRVCVSLLFSKADEISPDSTRDCPSTRRSLVSSSHLKANTAQGHNEALSLVNAHKSVTGTSDTATNSPAVNISDEAPGTQPNKKHEDLRRAKELVKLHYEFKSRHSNGEVDDALRKARENVELVLSELE